MGALFRSEEMTLCQLFLQHEAAYACVSELGELGLVQFKDLNPDVNAFQRKYVNEIMRCEEMERKLRYIEKELKKEGLKIPDSDSNPRAPAPKEMVDLEATFEKIESELREVNTNAEALKRNYLELTELRQVLIKTQNFFREQQGHHGIVDDAQNALVHDDRGGSVQLGFIAGVIPREKAPSFERMLWFACRGNVFLKYDEIQQDLEDPHTGDKIFKSVFIIFFQGEQLKSRVRKICEGFRATLYPCPETAQERQEMLSGVSTRLDDLSIVLKQTKDHRQRVLQNSQKEIHNWIIKSKKIKAIYTTLNMCSFDFARNTLIGECWAPDKVLDHVTAALRHGQEVSGSNIPNILHRMTTTDIPPTFFMTNRFTKVFQSIISAYGVASYREVNPAPYTIITFPFLFAVMFGDSAHGLIMFLFGLWMVVSEKKLLASKPDDEIVKTFLSGRYIIMMMGLFSMYTGIIYNDVFSKSVNIFGSSWHPNYDQSTMDDSQTLQLRPEDFFNNKTEGPYPFGVDPIWQASINKITFTNSFKMKVSVILGVGQMALGVCLSCFNHIHFGHYSYVIIQFVPELLFLMCIFGYLIALVFYKWLTFTAWCTQCSPSLLIRLLYSQVFCICTCIFGYLIALVFYKWLTFTAWCTQCSPSLLIYFINMFLMKYDKPDGSYKFDCQQYQDSDVLKCTSQTTFYPNQQMVQTILIVGALIQVPILLFAKPVALYLAFVSKSSRRQWLASTSNEQLVHHEILPGQESVEAGSSNGKPQTDKKAGEMELKTPYDEAELSEKEESIAIEKDADTEAAIGVNPGEVSVSINGPSSEPCIDIDPEEPEEVFDTGNILVGQAIHTIEFCLGCVSHTASYLRLWALSLAHNQLSEVLWSMLFRIALKMDLPFHLGALLIWAVFAIFAALTVAVLLLMEGLSAFLHTIRLHWVEFQSKFYHGEGYLFAPFNFKAEMDPTLDDSTK